VVGKSSNRVELDAALACEIVVLFKVDVALVLLVSDEVRPGFESMNAISNGTFEFFGVCYFVMLLLVLE
jgi:hypothetical protein